MEHQGFNVADITVIIILLVSGGLAFMRGLVREVFALGTWVGASAAAVFLYPLVKPLVAAHIKNEMAVDAATGLGIFCAALIILIPLGNFFASMIKGETLTAIDRSLGFVFGLVRGLLFLCLFYLCVTFLWSDPEKFPDWLASAKSRPLLSYGAEVLKNLVPKDAQEKAAEDVRKTRDRAEKAVEDAQRLQEMASPAPTASGKDHPAPAYDDSQRNGLGNLIDQKSKPQETP